MPRLVFRDGGFEIWDVDAGCLLIVPSVGQFLFTGGNAEERAKQMLYHIQGHAFDKGNGRKGALTDTLVQRRVGK